MTIAKVDIGIPCYGHQSSNWWLPTMNNLIQETLDGNIRIQHIFALHSAVPDYNKNSIISSQAFKYTWNEEEKRRASQVDANMTAITKRFLDGDSDWLFFNEDDTVAPAGTITKLINLGKPFVGGLYFNPGFPHNPIAYMRDEKQTGMYHAYYGYAKGALTQVDAIGLGCTLIHRSVFEKIIEEHIVFQRPDGSVVPIHKSKVRNRKFPKDGKFRDSYVKDGIYHQSLIELPHIEPEFDKRAYPFFGLEYGRTEDLFFAELCANVGIRPWVDTTIICKHFKILAVDEKEYEESSRKPANEAIRRIAEA